MSIIALGFVFGGALLGLRLQDVLPNDHRDGPSKEIIHLVMGLIPTMAALVLSLLILAAHTFYDAQQEEVQRLATRVILLDQALARYGPDAAAAREGLRADVAAALKTRSPDEGVGTSVVSRDTAAPRKTGLFDAVQALKPSGPAQQFDQAKALELLGAIASARLLIHEQASGATVPPALVVVVILWLTLLFVGFGLFAPANTTVLVATFLGAVSVAAALFLILDMGHPYRGLIHVSDTPILSALDQIRRDRP